MDSLRKLSREAVLYEKLKDGKTRCLACARRCVIEAGRSGFCGVRFNEGGRLMAPWGYVSGAALDPIEKKPFFHALPGAITLSFGMFGCNFTCDFCQNSHISSGQERAGESSELPPETLALEASGAGARVVVSTYNEPLITAEWGAAVFASAKAGGLRTAFVSNGYATPEGAAFLRPKLDLWKVDLKSFNADRYRRVCGAELARVKKGLELIKSAGFWMEVVTLLIPGFNDSEAETGEMAAYLAGLSRDIPWHLTAFHPAHRMGGAARTPASTLLRVRDLALKKGLRYVYCGNLPGTAGGCEDTACPSCGRVLIERRGFTVKSDRLGKTGTCQCGETIPGIFK